MPGSPTTIASHRRLKMIKKKHVLVGLAMRCAVTASFMLFVCPTVKARTVSSSDCRVSAVQGPEIMSGETKSFTVHQMDPYEFVTNLEVTEASDQPSLSHNSSETNAWWLTPLLASSRATTYDVAIILTNSTIFAIGTGSIFAGVAQGIYNSAKSYFIVNANELAWDYFDPPDRTAPFDLSTSLWTAAKHQATYRPVDTVFKYAGLLVSLEPETAVVYSLISAASSTTVFLVNHIAWDLALHPASEDPLSRFFRGWFDTPSEFPKQVVPSARPARVYDARKTDEDVPFVWPKPK